MSTVKPTAIELSAAPWKGPFGNEVTIKWEGHRPTITTNRLQLRPITLEDADFYVELFNNATAMRWYSGGPRGEEKTRPRVEGWVERWKEHPFSALCITERTEPTTRVGHVVLGLGTYTSKGEGWPEVAMIIHPKYMNAEKSNGSLGVTGIGAEAADALACYATQLKERHKDAPMAVRTRDLWKIDPKAFSRVIRDKAGKITAVFTDFKGVYATSNKNNPAMRSILKKFVEYTNGEVKPHPTDKDREAFYLPVA